MSVNTLCASIARDIRKLRLQAAHGILGKILSWNSISGHKAKEVVSQRFFAPTGKMALLCIYLVTVKALLGMKIGEPRCRQKYGGQ